MQAEPTSTETAAPKSRDSWFTEAIIGASSLFAGGVTAWREILSESYSAFTGLDIADPVKRKYRQKFGPQTYTEIESTLINVPESPEKAIQRKKIADKILTQSHNYNKEMEQLFNESAFGSHSWQGFKNRMGLLNSHDKWKIGLTAIAITGISLGSLLVLTKNLFHPDKDAKTDAPAIPRPESFVEAEQQKSKQQATSSLAI